MADEKSGETIRQMLSGFNAMQMQLGLLPTQTGQQPMGVQPYAPPPPPPAPHPSEFAFQAVQQQQMMMQQAVQTAQMTRYQPPPSAPIGGGGGFTWGSSYAAMGAGQMNPMVANAMGGGGIGMPNPIYTTAPQFGMYRPQGPAGGMMSPMAMRPPSIFNPLAPQIPAPHFMTPAMQQYQIMQARQAESLGLVGGIAEGALGVGGSLLGGALGGMLGPLGGMAGSWLGGQLGGVMSNMTIGPAFADVRRGRQLQSMTAPWMVAGAGLNPFTGQGMNREAATETARQLRTMVRDHDFQRTGFNTQDVMRITQLASDQGLLQTAQNPDDIARKVKDISKSVKALIQITGDPDVRNAIAHLGEMRQLGFQGLGGQMGAVANRAAFARMAGVSQAAMHEQFGMPGAMMAQNLGLAGATGYTAGLSGGGLGNVAVSAGALNDLQLARAGGKQGLGQMNAMAALGAINQDVFMGAAIRVGPNGQIDVDPEAYRRATQMSVSGASKEMGRRMAGLTPQQLMSYGRMQGELKDKLAQTMSPVEMQMNAIRQAQALMQDTGVDLGGALQVMTGGNADAARALELEWTNKGFYSGMQQQLRVQRREAADRERARLLASRTPGGLSQIGRGVRDVAGAASDLITSPVAGMMDWSQRMDENYAAQQRGEYVVRTGSGALLNTPQARAQAMQAGHSAYMRRLQEAAGAVNIDSRASMGFNRLGHLFGGAYNERNNAVSSLNQMRGSLFDWHTTYGDYNTAKGQLNDAEQVARAAALGQNMSVGETAAALTNVQATGLNAGQLVSSAYGDLMRRVPSAGLFTSATGVTKDDIKNSVISAARSQGRSQAEAEDLWNKQGSQLMALMARRAYQSGNKSEMEKFDKVREVMSRYGGSGSTKHEATQEAIKRDLEKQGLSGGGLLTGLSKESIESAKGYLRDTSAKEAAYVAAKATMLELGGLAPNAKESDLDPRLVNARKRAMAIIASVENGSDQTESARLQAIAADQLNNMGGGRRKALANMVGAGRGDLVEQVGTLKEMIGSEGYESSVMSGLSNLGLGGKTTQEALGTLSTYDDKKLATLSPKVRAAIEAYKKGRGDSKATERAGAMLESAFVESGAQETTSLTSAGNEGTAGIDKQISDLEALKNQLAKSDRPEDKANELFASSVQTFAEASKDLKEATENLRQRNADWLGITGGR